MLCCKTALQVSKDQQLVLQGMGRLGALLDSLNASCARLLTCSLGGTMRVLPWHAYCDCLQATRSEPLHAAGRWGTMALLWDLRATSMSICLFKPAYGLANALAADRPAI